MKLYGITGYKNAGKTTLVERLVAEFTARGLRVSTIKHAHHAFDLDQPGKDTYRHRAAGAEQVMLSTRARWVLMTELRGSDEPELADLLPQMADVDLILIEGYKRDTHPKIEVWRAETGHPLIAPGDSTIRAVASDGAVPADQPGLDLNNIPAIADFIWDDLHPKSAFDRFLMIDWNAGNDTGPTPRKDAIWFGDDTGATTYHRNRLEAEAALNDAVDAALATGQRLCIGVDFGLTYPPGFAEHVTGHDDPFALWDWFEQAIEDTPKANNRFDIAARLNRTLPGTGPFWANGLKRDIPDLPRKGTARDTLWPTPRREVETLAPGTFECWQMAGAGAVGSQIMMGLPMLARLRRKLGKKLCVWPLDHHAAPITLVEIWPGLIEPAVRAATGPDDIRDAVQVRLLAQACAELGPDLARLMDRDPSPDGWILGAEDPDALISAAFRALGRRG